MVGALPAAISETEAALESLKNSNPGSELVAGIEEFILANRRAAESLAVVREAATGAGGADEEWGIPYDSEWEGVNALGPGKGPLH